MFEIDWTAVGWGAMYVLVVALIAAPFSMVFDVLTAFPVREQSPSWVPLRVRQRLKKAWTAFHVNYVAAEVVRRLVALVSSCIIAGYIASIWFGRRELWHAILPNGVAAVLCGICFLRLWHQYDTALLLLDCAEKEAGEHARKSADVTLQHQEPPCGTLP